MDWPTAGAPSQQVITPVSACALGTELVALGAPAPASATVAVNLVYFIPFVIQDSLLLDYWFMWTGTSPSGSALVGVYSQDGVLLHSTSIASVSSGTIHNQGTGDFQLSRGLFWLAFATVSASLTSTAISLSAPALELAGVRTTTLATSLAATYPIPGLTCSATIVPLFGFRGKA